MRSTALKRASLWSTSCLILIALFSAVRGPFGTIDIVYRAALLFVLPLWLLFLPLAIRVKDAQGSRIWIILGSGTLTGCAVFAALIVIQILNRGNPSIIWQGYPTLLSMAVWTIFASAVGLIASAIYGIFLRVLYRRIQTA